MSIAFISTITETTSMNATMIDLSFYTIIAGLVGWIWFGKEKKRFVSKALFSLMIVVPVIFFVVQFWH